MSKRILQIIILGLAIQAYTFGEVYAQSTCLKLNYTCWPPDNNCCEGLSCLNTDASGLGTCLKTPICLGKDQPCFAVSGSTPCCSGLSCSVVWPSDPKKAGRCS